MRHPGARLPAAALRGLRARQAGRFQLAKRRGFCPSCGARRMAQTAAHLVDHVIPHVPVRQWVLSMPIPLRLLLAAQPKLVTPVLQVVHRVITRHLRVQAGLKPDEADSGAVTLIQRFGSAANLNIHLHCLALDGVYRRSADGVPVFVQSGAPSDDELHALLHTVIARLMKMLTRHGILIEEMAREGMARELLCSDIDGNSEARGRAGRSARAQAAGAAVPLHHPAGAGRRTGTAQRRRSGGSQAHDPLARRHHAPGDEPAGVPAAAKPRPPKLGPHASAGHGCSSGCSISTCSAARTAAPGSSRSSQPSWSAR